MRGGSIDLDEVKVKSIMSKDFQSISNETTVEEVKDLLVKMNFSSLPIVQSDALQGIVAVFDFIKLFDVEGYFNWDDFKNKPVSRVERIKRRGVVFLHPEDSLRKCIEYMSSFRLRYLPIVDNKKVVGMVSIGDVIKFLCKE